MDDGDIDMIRVVRMLYDIGYDGVIVPDPTPEMSCGAPWHAGMAYALGYIRAAMQAVERLTPNEHERNASVRMSPHATPNHRPQSHL